MIRSRHPVRGLTTENHYNDLGTAVARRGDYQPASASASRETTSTPITTRQIDQLCAALLYQN
jgi:hypothetical protein